MRPAILQVLDVRERKADRKSINVVDLAARYLAAVEKVTAAVDMALGRGVKRFQARGGISWVRV